MLTNLLRPIYARELRTLVRELDAYPDDATVWRDVPGQPNTAGTLVLHLLGNLNHFIGSVLGGTGYVRDRHAEFSERGASRAELRSAANQTAMMIDRVLERLPPSRLDEPFPVEFRGTRLGTGVTLIHLAAHLAFHLGQIDYHRRAATGDATGVGVIVLAELVE